MLQSVAISTGIGKTHYATALGHIAVRRRHTVAMTRAEKLFTRLRAARLDQSLETEFRRLARLDLLIIDDFALKALDPITTNDFYELAVERHARAASTIITSNRDPAEWLTLASDQLLAQAAVDRLTGHAHTLILDGPSYRQRRPTTHPS
jgi:DNA replication protein DnaC